MSEFEELVDAHYQALFRFAMSLSREEATASDLVQETFCIWAEKGDQLRDKSKAKTWLFTTLHREFLSHRRRASRYSDEPLDEKTTESIPSPEEDADRQLDGQRALVGEDALAAQNGLQDELCGGKVPVGTCHAFQTNRLQRGVDRCVTEMFH